ncbi:MAG: arylsulfatase A-like enzyme, partial [Limisphaerales bacterium]
MQCIFAMLILVCGCATMSAQSGTTDKPNILFVVFDDLNDYVGHLNSHPQAVSPTIDALSKKGTSFKNAYCNTPQCAPSRISLLSGKSADYSGVYQSGQYNGGDIRSNFNGEEVYFLPEVLKDSGGYYTVTLSKIFHGKSSNPPYTDIDFDTSDVDQCAKGKSWNEWINVNIVGPEPEPDPSVTYGLPGYEWGQLDNAVEPSMQDNITVDKALDFLATYNSDPANFCDKPFFLAVGLFRPHIPFFSPEKFWSDFYQPDLYQMPYDKPYNDPPNAFPPNGVTMPSETSSIDTIYNNLPFLGKVNSNGHNIAPDKAFIAYPEDVTPVPVIDASLSPEEVDFVISEQHRANALMGYLAGVQYVDAQLGRIITYLESKPDLLANTIIVVISDHGYAMGEKKHWGKVALWDQVLRVPLIIVDPRRGGNQTVNTPTTLIDLYPTILELTNTPVPTFSDGSTYLEGISLVPQLDNPLMDNNRVALSATALSNSYPDGNCFPFHSVRDNEYHYIHYISNGAEDTSNCDFPNSRVQEELYLLGLERDGDEEENINLANNPDYRGIMDYMIQFIPGGALHNQEAGFAEIKSTTALECIVNLKDSNVFEAVFHSPDGTIYDGFAAPNMTYTWSSPVMLADQTTRACLVKKGLIDSILLLNYNKMPLKLTIRDTVLGLRYDQVVELSFDPIKVPTISFFVSKPEDHTAEVYNISIDGNYNSVEWDFDDSYFSNDLNPARHSYTRPGTYLITCSAYYGNDKDSECVRKLSTIFTVDTSEFLDCLIPEGVRHSDLTPRSVKMIWNPVFGAVDYRLRFKKNEGGNTSWSNGVKIQNYITIKGLDANSEYTFEVAANCTGLDQDTSAYSYKHVFATNICEPPVDVQVLSLTPTTATIDFTPHNGEIIAHQVVGRPAAIGYPKFFVNIAGDTSGTATGLTPGTDYEFKVLPFCQDNNGNSTVKGPYTSGTYTFTTPTVKEESGLDNVNFLEVMPNPANESARINFSKQFPTNSLLRVTDFSGRKVFENVIAKDQQYIEIQTGLWNPGT